MSGFATYELTTAMTNCYFKRTLPIHDQVELALCGKVPAINAAVTQLFEPSAASYARITVPLDDTHWDTAPDGSVYNAAQLLYPLGATSWGYLPGWAIVASLSVGEYTPRVLATGRLQDPVKHAAGDQLRLDIGQVAFALVNSL